ncbi:MAG: hypothetical protein ACXAEU_23110 [Candidatus Hodarchaeales archaeon]
MNEKIDSSDVYKTNKAISYSLAYVADLMAYQTFTFLVFTFYFAVVGLRIEYISVGFIFWAFCTKN